MKTRRFFGERSNSGAALARLHHSRPSRSEEEFAESQRLIDEVRVISTVDWVGRRTTCKRTVNTDDKMLEISSASAEIPAKRMISIRGHLET
jgi:hypothetical protein